MSALRILSCGPLCTLQDAGRVGHLRYGVGANGPMDWRAYELAEKLAGNETSASSLEVSLSGITLEAMSAVTVGIAGSFNVKRGETHLPPIGRYALKEGDRLQLSPSQRGAWGYISTPSGFHSDIWLGSGATDLIAGKGGYKGRALQAGDILSANPQAAPAPDMIAASEVQVGSSRRLAVIPGPQSDAFTQNALNTFYEVEFVLTPSVNRMGYRLSGPQLDHVQNADIVSDGIAPGAIQVPGDGQPIALMAGRQPTGGYAKIAVLTDVARAQLAQTRPGDSVSFFQDDGSSHSAQTARQQIQRCADTLEPMLGSNELSRLLNRNLIDGVTDGSED